MAYDGEDSNEEGKPGLYAVEVGWPKRSRMGSTTLSFPCGCHLESTKNKKSC
jgi:hypothetical protein